MMVEKSRPGPLEPTRLILGMSRGGTTAMVRCLNLHGRVAAFGETAFWGSKWVEPRADGFYHEEELEKVAFRMETGSLGPNSGIGNLGQNRETVSQVAAATIREINRPMTPGETFRAMGRGIARAFGKRLWVEKTPHHMMHLDRIFRYAAPVRMLVMLRNPERFLLSYKHQGDRMSAAARRTFHNLYHPAVASIVCKGYLTQALAAQENHPESTLVVRLEELVADPSNVLDDIHEHLELPEPKLSEFPEDNSSFEGAGEIPELAPHERTWLGLIAGDSATRLGLDLPDGKSGILRLIPSAVQLIPWAFKNVSVLRRVNSRGVGDFIKRWL